MLLCDIVNNLIFQIWPWSLYEVNNRTVWDVEIFVKRILPAITTCWNMYLFSNDPNARVYPSPCKCYSDLRSVWLEKLVLSDGFFPLEMNQQLGEVLNHPCNVKPTALS